MEPTSSRLVSQIAACYELLLSEVKPATIEVGQTVTSTTQGNPYWAFSGQAGQIVDIAMTTVDSSFDPYLTLYGARGIKLAENGDSGGTLQCSEFLPSS